jgi:hypothetical protein
MIHLGKVMTDAIKRELDIHSPSRKMAWVADMAMAGLVNDLDPAVVEKQMKKVSAAVSNVELRTGKTKLTVAGVNASEDTAAANQHLHVHLDNATLIGSSKDDAQRWIAEILEALVKTGYQLPKMSGAR